MKKAKTSGLISVVAIAMALTIVFSGAALASQHVPPTKETEILDITTNIKCNGSVVESQRLHLEIDSVNLLDNPPLDDGERYGKIRYDEKMIASHGTTEFDNSFAVNTGTTPNLYVTKNIGYKSGDLGSLSHAEEVGMKVIAAGKTTETTKYELCPFHEPTKTTTKVPGSYEEVNAYSKMAVVTDVAATTMTEVGITVAPVNLNYKIGAEGTGLVAAGVSAFVEDGRGGADSELGSRWTYKEYSMGYGENVKFTKDIGYTSVYSP